MKKEEFLDINREYFKHLGFQTLKKSKFYYDAEDFTLRVSLVHSNFSEVYYIDFDIRLKELHPEVKIYTNDQPWDTIVAGRVCYNNDEGFIIEYSLWEKECYLAELTKVVKQSLVPIMKDGTYYVKKLISREIIVDGAPVFYKDVVDKYIQKA